MDATTDFRCSLVRVRALSLRALARAGGTIAAWQLRWALEPLLADHVVPLAPMPSQAAADVAAGGGAAAAARAIARSVMPATWE